MNTITTSVANVFNRSADTNHSSMDELLVASRQEMNESRTIQIKGSEINFSHEDGNIMMGIPNQGSLPVTNYAMTQVAGMAKIPVAVLERLHAKNRNDLIVDNLNTLFVNNGPEKSLLIRDHYQDDGDIQSVVRAVNGHAYSRLWDNEVFIEMEDLLMTNGFTPMLPDLHSNAMRNGLMHNLDAGLFRGDRSSFGFFFAEDEPSNVLSGSLRSGVMVWNSEVGARSFGFHTFYYHERSGSIIIWTPSNHQHRRFIHRGNIQHAFSKYVTVLEDTAVNFKSRSRNDCGIFDTASYTTFAESSELAVQRLQSSFKMSTPKARAVVAASNLPQNTYNFSSGDFSVFQIALGIAWEAGQTSRADSMVDDTLVATRVIRSCLKV